MPVFGGLVALLILLKKRYPIITWRRIVLLGLLVIPVILIVMSLGQRNTDSAWELLFLIIGLPILILNAWEWFMPKVAEALFGKR